MKARVVVFPVRGRNWCFSRCPDPAISSFESDRTPRSLKDLCNSFSSTQRSLAQNAELAVDFVAFKMNRAWNNLEKAPPGSFKSRIHSLGLRLLSRVKPSENFLKSISKEITEVEVTYPMSLNPQLVRRRLRHIAMRGSIIHKRYFYGSITLLPLTTILTVLPAPNIPFFWILFRAYSHWQALKGSERLLLLVSNCSKSQYFVDGSKNRKETDDCDVKKSFCRPRGHSWVLQPSEDLEKLINKGDNKMDCVSDEIVSKICKAYDLNKKEVLKYRESM